MCGYFYSNTIVPSNKSLTNVKRRGPDGFDDYHSDLGYFAHALLVTIAPKTPQPIKNNHGVLVYNGSIYGVEGNDTRWLISQLDDNMDHCIQVIKSLRGEYSLTWVTDNFIIFCADQWVTRNLWYYFSPEDKVISISSVPDVIKEYHTGAWPCQGNKIYILDKNTWTISTQTNTEWDLTQTVNSYDSVFENFEKAVELRITDNHVISLSAGYDSGVIACAAKYGIQTKYNLKYVAISGAEDKEILFKRLAIHKARLIKEELRDQDLVDDFLKLTHQPNAQAVQINRYTQLCDTGKKLAQHIHLTGRGGDEIYCDYGFNGQELSPSSHFGGFFPSQLDLVWPWHGGRSFLYEAVTMQDYAYGYNGCEARVPLLDQLVVQSWLNTTHTLKNSKYKGWITEYMDTYDYPYDKTGMKVSGFGCEKMIART